MWSDTVSVAPTEEPITVIQAKDFLRIAHASDDEQIARMVQAARKFCEDYQHRAYCTQTRVLRLDRFPWGAIDMFRAPLASITSIAYLDENGTSQTWASTKYQVDIYSTPGRVMPTNVETYPVTQDATYNTVTITYVAGAAAVSVSPMIQESILRMTRNLWEGCSLNGAADANVCALLDQERIWVPT